MITIHNKGLMKMPDLEELLLPAISCPIEIVQNTRGGIRLRLLRDLIEVEVRNANGDTSYNADKICAREQVFTKNPFHPFFGVIAGNNNRGITNDIDIEAIYVKNLDENSFKDKSKLEELRLKYLLRKHQAGFSEDTTEVPENIHAHDLLAIKH